MAISPNWAFKMKEDPLLPAVSFIAGRFSFRATGRGSCCAEGTKQAKGLIA